MGIHTQAVCGDSHPGSLWEFTPRQFVSGAHASNDSAVLCLVCIFIAIYWGLCEPLECGIVGMGLRGYNYLGFLSMKHIINVKPEE